MKYLFTLLALFIISITSASAAEEIKFHYGEKGAYIVELISSENLGEVKGLEVIAKAGREKCGDKPAHFGKYRFKGEEKIGSNDGSGEESFRMVQQLFCGELPTITQEPTRPLSLQKRNKLEGDAKKLTNSYLDYLARSDLKNAYSLLSSGLKEGKTYEEWVETRRHLSRSEGDLVRSEIWGVTTYVDPPSSSRKGIYIATDFDREYTGTPIYCGYLVWYLEDGDLRLVREDIGSINLDQFNEMKTGEILTVKSKFRCKPPTSQENKRAR